MRRKFTLLSLALPLFALTACGLNGTGREAEDDTVAASDESADNEADAMASRDAPAGEAAQIDIPDSEERPIMQLQVVLDRQAFGPGVIDGKMGMSTENALRGFQEANALEVTGAFDEATKAKLADYDNIPATRVVTIPQDWGQIDYTDIPEDPAEQAELDRMGYESIEEKLAERFHTTPETLAMLNPGGRPAGAKGTAGASPSSSPSPSDSATASASPSPSASASGNADEANGDTRMAYRPGQQIRVPNIGADRIAPGAIDDDSWKQTLVSLGVGSEQPELGRIVVSKSDGVLRGYDEAGKLIALFTVTSGSENDPLPLGDWKILGEAYNPPFSYNPELFWDVPDSEEKQLLPPGPNGPVGVVWIDLSKEHYGIHGTPAPETIGRAQSHGCVRLTNWDAARLAQMVSQSTEVTFEA
jgi:lipoprotein-anchoring transpeptidase ErfK/SrfK/predicted small lipoprotein YifL